MKVRIDHIPDLQPTFKFSLTCFDLALTTRNDKPSIPGPPKMNFRSLLFDFIIFVSAHSLNVISPSNLSGHLESVVMNRFFGPQLQSVSSNLTAPFISRIFFGANFPCGRDGESFTSDVASKIVLLQNKGESASLATEEKVIYCLQQAGAISVVRIISYPLRPG